MDRQKLKDFKKGDTVYDVRGEPWIFMGLNPFNSNEGIFVSKDYVAAVWENNIVSKFYDSYLDAVNHRLKTSTEDVIKYSKLVQEEQAKMRKNGNT